VKQLIVLQEVDGTAGEIIDAISKFLPHFLISNFLKRERDQLTLRTLLCKQTLLKTVQFNCRMKFKVHTGPSHKSLSLQHSSGIQKTLDILVQLLVMNLILCTHFFTEICKILSR
jgi:hypothetical protein